MGNEKIRHEDVRLILDSQLPWEKLKGKKVLVTGGTGFFPSLAVDVLLELANVTLLVRNETRASEKFKSKLKNPNLKIIQSNPLSVNDLGDNRFDYILHAASPASPKAYGEDPMGPIETNVHLTLELLKRAKKDQAKFVFISSAEVYGIPAADGPQSEDRFGHLDPFSLRACYAESKRMGENLCRIFFERDSVPVWIVRPFHVYGPGMNFEDGRVFADLVRDVVSRREIQVHGDGSAVRAFCYVSDAILGLFTILLKGQPGQAYNLGNEEGVTSVRDLAMMLGAEFQSPGVAIGTGKSSSSYVASPVSRIVPSTLKLRELGWKPLQSLKSGFRRTVESYWSHS